MGAALSQGLQEALIRRTSDHWPIVMDTNPFMWGPTPFRFENMWLQHPNFKENFRNWWSGFQGNGWEGHKFMRRLQYVGGLTSDLLRQRASRKGELEELILRDEIHWRQKARVKWVKEGDCNTKFYHKVANGRRNRKYIKELENERGLVLKNAESITEEILLYFEKLYTSPTGESWGVEGLDWSPISEESALRLDSPFTEKEISKAIFQMDRDKAPRPDDFTITVFQDCWDVIKEELVRVFAEFHRSGIINQSTNASFIVLLPKKSLTKRISDFRPISLITSLYKITAKVLSGRLRGVLHETIPYTQGVFVQGRQILDAVLIANEIVDERRRSGEEGIVFKIDFEKAYDHVKWDFLDHALEKKGFSPRWRKWMSECLSSVSYAILANGSAKGWVKASRGLRQEEELQTLKGLLLVFGHISGLKPILYLGLPLGGNPKACSFWDPAIERILNSRFSGCKNREVAKGFFMVRDWGRQKRSFSEVGGCVQTEGNRGFGFWEYFLEKSRSSREMVVEMVTSLSLEGYCTSLSGVFLVYSICVLGPTRPFSWNLNFRRNLSDSEIEDLEGLMQSLDELHLSPSDFPSKFVWNSQVPFKVKSFVLLVAHKKVILMTCFKLFQLAKMDWVPPRSISDMMSIKFKGFGTSKRGIVLWQAASIALIRVVWWERNAMIFQDKARNSEFLWDSIFFLASLWDFCSKAFKGNLLNVIQLDWITVCTP
ncbi:Transposon TX1 uncharacterized 149 kDa protein [Vitis vinifera]|uniref:Transposon TX1 uncharacterized 149 kDa protein n=1 Tax=Vitis vinifera TaxID=29760 RepID=A0A438EES5_VITVI|nr:Transposon TX1 uncharacterized 149 kDa protein [Vitis vinifera]